MKREDVFSLSSFAPNLDKFQRKFIGKSLPWSALTRRGTSTPFRASAAPSRGARFTSSVTSTSASASTRCSLLSTFQVNHHKQWNRTNLSGLLSPLEEELSKSSITPTNSNPPLTLSRMMKMNALSTRSDVGKPLAI